MIENNKPTIWVVEDTNLIREELISLLSETYNVVDFSLASTAIEKLKSFASSDNVDVPVMILTDHKMQTELTTGLDVIKEATALGIPSVLLSGDVRKIEQKAKDLGAFSVLRKPHNEEELFSAIESSIGTTPTLKVEDKMESNVKEKKFKSLFEGLGLKQKASGRTLGNDGNK